MKISIVPEDGTVVIDGVGFEVDCSSIDSAIHSVQWDQGAGHIEYVQPDRMPEPIDDISPFQTVIDAHIAKAAAIDAEANAPPSTDPADYPLTRFQFKAALNLMGKTVADLEAAVAAGITDPVQKAFALAAISDPPGDTYQRNNPLFANADILTALGLTAAQIDTIWMQVKDVRSV
jgi:hypothetical protein